MMGESVPDPFAGHPDWALTTPKPIVPTPATMVGQLRGRRAIIGLPGLGWRSDMRIDEKVVQGSRTYVPVMPEGEWYRAEAEQTEVFAALVPVERVWIEELGVSGRSLPTSGLVSKLVSLDEPPRRVPLVALDAGWLTGRRMIRVLDNGTEQRDLRAVTELHANGYGDICARVAEELDWYRWGWSGREPKTLEVAVNQLWVE